MSVLAEVKKRITSALRSGNQTEKNIFRCVLGDVQTKASSMRIDPTDELVYDVMKRHTVSLRETIPLAKKDGRDIGKLEEELRILTDMLPKPMSKEEIKSFLTDSGVVQEIKNARSEGQSIGLAMKLLKSNGCVCESTDVKEVIVNFRKQS